MVDRSKRWWSGVLDVEGLAIASVDQVCASVSDLSSRRGCRRAVTTTPELIAASFAAIENLRIAGRRAVEWAPLSGFVQASDGWVRLHGNYPHHAAAITEALGATDRDELNRIVGAATAQSVEDTVSEAGGIATVVRTEVGWSAHPHEASTHAEPWHEEQLGAERAHMPEATLPFEGVKVLDLTRVIAGPTCSQLLACLGADVLRIDPPQRPELLDQYLSNGMGKRSAEADLATYARHLHDALLPLADVVLLGYRPGSLAKYGLDPDSLLNHNPRAVVASLSAWGERGPWGERAGFDSIVQAATGIAALCASADGRPGALPVQALDHATGHILAARVASLLARKHGGIIRASLLGAARTLLTLPRGSHEAERELTTPTVTMDTPYGHLTAVPPAILLDGGILERAITAYGTSPLLWRS